MTTMDDVLIEIQALKETIDEIISRPVSGQHVHTVGGLSEISKNLGLMTAGEFRTGNGIEPGKGFSGVRMAYPAMSYEADNWNIAGVSNDVLEFGLNANDGKAYFGAGVDVLDSDGLHISTSLDIPFLDGSSSGSNTNGTASTTLSWAHTVPSGYTDQILSLQVAIRGNVAVSGITWTPSGGSAEDATYELDEEPGTDIRVEVWYLVNPTPGGGTIEVTLASSQNMAASAIGLWNVDQTSPVNWSSGNSVSAGVWLEILTGSMAAGDFIINAFGAQSATGSYCIPWNGILLYDDMTGQSPGHGVAWTLPTSDITYSEIGWFVDYPHYAVDTLAGIAVAYASAGTISKETMAFSDTGVDIVYGGNNFRWNDSGGNLIADLNLSGDVVYLRGANSLVLQTRTANPLSRLSMRTAGIYSSSYGLRFLFESIDSGGSSHYLLNLGTDKSAFNLLDLDIDFGVGAYSTYGYIPYTWGIFLDAGVSRLHFLWNTMNDASNGNGVIYIGNRYTAPTTNPAGGGVLYAESGALKWRGSSGTTTTIANA